MANLVLALAAIQDDDYGNATGSSPLVSFIEFLLVLLVIASMWKIFVKAGKPGWAAIIPIYNIIVGLGVAGKPVLLWFIFLCFPIVNIGAWLLVNISLADKFGKGALFGFGLFFLPFIFLPVLAFGDAEYMG